jgi:predicted transcriptional regulator of viral defense system
MKTTDAIKILSAWDKEGRYVFRTEDLKKLFGAEQFDTFHATLRRLVKQDVLTRCARSVYVYAQSVHIDGYTTEKIADTIRRGEYNFIGLESALSYHGVISQILIDRLTVVTTGRRGEYATPYGVIEFTHTESSPETILENTQEVPPHILRIATREYALAGLRRVGRNLDMVTENDQ